MEIVCPSCGNKDTKRFVGVEYPYYDPDHYDGVSEWNCLKCQTRWGRWSGKVLADGEAEAPFGVIRKASGK